MSVRKQITDYEGIYFITFTCYKWLSLIDKVNGYEIVYQQFDYLKQQGHYIVSYVIMPNHVHALIAFRNSGKTINSIVGNIKRFMAYEIGARLKASKENELLTTLAAGVNNTDKKRGKLHEVFEPSFDCKECSDNKRINQKLNYMHDNPCTGAWDLANSPIAYPHSSAQFYITGEQGIYEIMNYMALEDIDLTTAK
jgi:REP element-mobilizing transposase RayT